jgi:ligand-binding sensor domain-containing protein
MAFNTAYELFTNVPGGQYPLFAIADNDGLMWTGDTYGGLSGYNPATSAVNHVSLSGPLTALAFSMTSSGNDLYIAPGGIASNYGPLFISPEIYKFNSTDWTNYAGYNNPMMTVTHDIVSIAVDPNDSKHVFAGTFGSGLLEIRDNAVVRRFTSGNSTLHNHYAADTSDVRVGGVAFDAAGNLWVVNSANNNCLSRKKGDSWIGFNIPTVNQNDLGKLLIDRHGQKWIQMRYGTMNSNSIMVFSDNDTPENPADDKVTLLNSSAGSGNIPGTTVLAMAEDQKGEIWVGTEKGVGVFY